MHEVLSKSPNSRELPDDAQFIELRLSDIGPDDEYPSFWVMETCAQWDAANKRIVWDDPQLYAFENMDSARDCYEERRRVLAEKGFRYSDLDW